MIVGSIRKSSALPTYPARPSTGRRLTLDVIKGYGPGAYTAKVDGDHVIGNMITGDVYNRHGQPYRNRIASRQIRKLYPLWKWLVKGTLVEGWTGRSAHFEDTVSYENYVKDEANAWVSAEFLCKHKLWKNRVAPIDFPMRQFTHMEMRRTLRFYPGSELPSLEDQSQFPPLSLHVNSDGTYNFRGLRVLGDYGLILPFVSYAQASGGYTRSKESVLQFYKRLRVLSEKYMKHFGETTPFYEGVVFVESIQEGQGYPKYRGNDFVEERYPIQLADSSRKLGNWIKHRFST